MTLKTAILRALRVKQASAHCDIPCGIYDPVSAKIAAQTVLKMVMRIEGLGHDHDNATQNSLARYITVKEEHATLCKKELDILWHDYFRPDHLEANPDLHTKIWNATKLAGANKQNVNLESAKQLVDAVDEIAGIFWATKGVEYNDAVSDVRFGT
jgi:nickel superoxide dismutase